ncbi:hypothetical protein NE237_007352 [Protea cynaroides]|uniref:Uncharacterized protein n=1 Tax=Protea cynaroides TaxID=273540 RepID=A0A9Q0KP01_9MAGN|nr:hypothetical protein NE237_007352 [Protea cynaroides]
MKDPNRLCWSVVLALIVVNKVHAECFRLTPAVQSHLTPSPTTREELGPKMKANFVTFTPANFLTGPALNPTHQIPSNVTAVLRGINRRSDKSRTRYNLRYTYDHICFRLICNVIFKF